ncbi:TRAP transporter small permease [Ectopseudomonas khazarica]|uniref:TRAP transporter small permease n=2 Tax=Pseudomonadales TaxID=72274 RepID=UPI00106DFED7|nr:TRAP transporter small permease [Pseudomonas khazarica]
MRLTVAFFYLQQQDILMNKLLTLMVSIDKFLMLIIKPVVVVISFLVAVFLAYGIFARAVMGKPVFGLEELVLLGAMWLYMLGAVLASRDRSHLTADFIEVMFKNPKTIQAFRIVAALISLVMAIFFASWSYDLLYWAVIKGQSSTVLKMPWYLSQSSLFVASILFIFYQLRDVLNDINSFRSCSGPDQEQA